MRLSLSLIFIICLGIAIKRPNAQHSSWNLLLEKKVGRYLGSQVYETDSFYYVVGTSIDTFNTLEQGFSISKVNKKDASVVATRHYEEKDVELDFNDCNNGVLVDKSIFFSQLSEYSPYFIALYKLNVNTLDVEKVLNIPLPDTASEYPFFLNDFHVVDNNFYILTKYYTGEYDTPSFNGVEILIKYNLENQESKIITFLPITKKTLMNKTTNINNNLITFGTVVGAQLATGKMAITKMDIDGNLIWQYETPSLSPINNVKDIHPINDKEVLLASYDSFFDYSDLQLYSRWTVTRYDVENKKIVWSNFWNEPRKPYIWGNAKIIKTKKEGEYFLMANDDVSQDTFNYGTGKIVKFNAKGQRIWQKSYYFRTNWSLSNDFNNIISTSDGNCLIVGYESLGRAPWLVKIDEDGNILPIDTTSANSDQTIQNTIPEIKIHPNPASHSIIINQGEITDMTYQLIDMNGGVLKSIPLPHAHHNVVWDISDVVAGTYILSMKQGEKLIGSKRQVVIK